MKVRNIFYHLINILLFIVLFDFIHFILQVFIQLDIAISATSFFGRSEFELMIYEIRKIWGFIFSILLTCFIDYFYLKKLLKLIKLEKYSKIIFKVLGGITGGLIIGLFIFCKVYPL